MNARPERSTVISAWLEEGPDELPESTRRAIAVDIRTTRQSRRSIWARWQFPTVDRLSLVAMAAATVVVLAVAGLAGYLIAPGGGYVGGPPPAPSPSPSPSPPDVPSASPSIPTTLVIPVMTESYVSGRYGYSIRYPADWSAEEATETWSPADWKTAASTYAPFDFIGRGEEPPMFRAASALLPEGLPDVDDWIDEYLTYSSDAGCAPPRETWELVSIDGVPARLRDSCGEVEVTVVHEERVYLFTLFVGEVANGRALFDAFAATIQLRPEAAAAPDPGP